MEFVGEMRKKGDFCEEFSGKFGKIVKFGKLLGK
jgi:hypothetical protein